MAILQVERLKKRERWAISYFFSFHFARRGHSAYLLVYYTVADVRTPVFDTKVFSSDLVPGPSP